MQQSATHASLPEEIATYAEAFRTSPHFREQKDPYVLSVIISDMMMLGLDSPLMQRGLDAVLRESLVAGS